MGLNPPLLDDPEKLFPPEGSGAEGADAKGPGAEGPGGEGPGGEGPGGERRGAATSPTFAFPPWVFLSLALPPPEGRLRAHRL